METHTLIGMSLLLLGAVCGGSFGLPSKFVKKEIPWEVLWGSFFFFVAILIPTTIFPFIADGLFSTCSKAGIDVIIMPLIFGFLWGLGSITLGKSFAFIGLSLAYAINYGAQIATGGLAPIIIHNPEELVTPHGAIIVIGVIICIVGVVICGRAAILKNKSQANENEAGDANPTGSKLMKGLLVAFASGILCACYGIAFSYGGKIMEISGTDFGNAGWETAFVVSALILWGGSLSACGYCIYKLSKNKTWGSFTEPGITKVLAIALIMGILHDGAILLYGVGASKLGALGAAVGYAVFMAFAIIVGNVTGFISGEWKGASKRSVNWIAMGIIVLIIGVSVLTKGNFMQGEANKNSPQNIEKGE